ncbi:MAG TPA: amidophosphoribosyltransferase, partial [Candidatus Aenigmarchaeota archaeon]|nr:amidophosphoribosyltransferase [Candidatus Aenigmarchaeota archaeon]
MIRHNCGIGGAYQSNELVLDLYEIGTMLQHRGHEAAGIAVVEKGTIKDFKDMGSVSEVFDKKIWGQEIGAETGIVHNRYSTTPVSTIAQPLTSTEVAIAHNGNLVNVDELSRKYGALPETDSWFILRIFEEEEGDLVKAGLRCFDECKGAYNVVAINRRGDMLALRDKYGFHPLFIGNKDNAWYVASETIALAGIGVRYDDIEEIAPGEMVLFSENKRETISVENAERRECFFEYCYFAHHLSHLNKKGNSEIRRDIGKKLWEKYKLKADIVTYIPNSGLDYGKGFSAGAGIPLEEVFAVNTSFKRVFITPEGKEMRNGLHLNRYSRSYLKLVPGNKVKGKSVIVADDSIVRSNVVNAASRRLFESGAKEVHFVIGVPPIKYPCFYGIDFPTSEELIAYHIKSNNEVEIGRYVAKLIANNLGIDEERISVNYLGLKELMEVFSDEKGYCYACLNGDY